MRFLKNRTVLGVLCIVLSLIICFAVTPLFNKAMSEKTEIVRVVKPISVGEEITSDMVKTIEVGSYNLPDDVVKHSDTVVGAFASADLAPGDYILTSKIAEEPAAENAYLYHLTGEKQAISVTVKAFANGLSGKLKSGDIVSVIAPDYRKQGKTVIPAEAIQRSLRFHDLLRKMSRILSCFFPNSFGKTRRKRGFAASFP